jgi:hypothetical protein
VKCSSLILPALELGRSALGNAILGQTKFKEKQGVKSETSVWLAGEREFDGRRLIAVDTPGLCGTNADRKRVAKEIDKAFAISSAGPHCFIMTISARNRFTGEAQKTIDLLCKIFGRIVLDHCIFVFTNEDGITEEDITFEEWLAQHIPRLPGLAPLIKSYGRRCMAFNSRSKSVDELNGKVRQLVSMIDEIVARNYGRVYTYEMYKEAKAAPHLRKKEKRRQAAEMKAATERKEKEVSTMLMMCFL